MGVIIILYVLGDILVFYDGVGVCCDNVGLNGWIGGGICMGIWWEIGGEGVIWSCCMLREVWKGRCVDSWEISMWGDFCGCVYCGSICEGICSVVEDICGVIGVIIFGCWSVGVVLVLFFLRYFFGFCFDFFLLLGWCDDCGLISKLCFLLLFVNIFFFMDWVLFIWLVCFFFCWLVKEGLFLFDVELDW